MRCHECAVRGGDAAAVGLCKFCLVGLCKAHLVELYRDPVVVPQFACRHRPGDGRLTA